MSGQGQASGGDKPGDDQQSSKRATHQGRSRRLTWKVLLRRGLALAVTGLTIYLVVPKLSSVLAAWPRLEKLDPVWLAAGLVAEIASFTCYFALERLALRTKAWFAVVTARLTGNAISLSVPGGAAAGAAVQYEMLGGAGFDSDAAVSGLTAISLLNLGDLLALPLFALPALLAGIAVKPGLLHAAEIGAGGFVLLAIAVTVALLKDWPLTAIGHAAQWLRNHVLRNRPAMTGLDERLLTDRDNIKRVLGLKWPQAVALTGGRVGLDYGCLLAVLAATGARPHPSLVLLAYAAANIIGTFPVTPGGLGLVEASLGGLLVLAGVRPSAAFVATLAYRLASYWLPLAAGLPAYGLFRHRYGPVKKHSSAPKR
jgi:uncharacterized membrane protein YbhN (UPF0104 family)